MKRGDAVEVLDRETDTWVKGMVRRENADNTYLVAITSENGHAWDGRELTVDSEHIREPECK
jgi:arylsulfatase A-like enzyme